MLLLGYCIGNYELPYTHHHLATHLSMPIGFLLSSTVDYIVLMVNKPDVLPKGLDFLTESWGIMGVFEIMRSSSQQYRPLSNRKEGRFAGKCFNLDILHAKQQLSSLLWQNIHQKNNALLCYATGVKNLFY